MVAYRADDKRGWVAICQHAEVAFWRNAHALFEAGRSENSRILRPATVAHVARPQAREVLGESAVYSIEAGGMVASQSRVDALRTDRVDAALRQLDDPDAGEAVRHVLDVAGKTVAALNRSVEEYAVYCVQGGEAVRGKKGRQTKSSAKGEEASDEAKDLAKSLGAESAAWSQLGLAFDAFLRGLAQDIDVARCEFEAASRTTAWSCLQRALAAADASGASLKARALAERSLRLALAAVPRTDDRSTSPMPLEDKEERG
jgi:hypothetical protein